MKKFETKDALALLSAIQQGNGVAVMNNRKVRSKVFFIAGLAAGLAAKNNQLITGSLDKETGITNFEKGNVLPAGQNFLCTAIRLRFDTTASITPQTASWKSEAPPVFQNGELVIRQDGSGNIVELPISVLSKYNASIATEDEFRAVVPFVIREAVPFEILAVLAGATAADQAYRLELDGILFTDADKA